MYPLNLFSLFPPFPRENKVFVAMSFDKRFDKRWAEVIVPGVRYVKVNGAALEPYRVDAGKVSDSILTEILIGISNCRLFLADITTIGEVSRSPMRNANVMYEVGIAHAVRLAEEVILFRSDNDPLLFDVANIRINKYDPDAAPEVARQQVTDALRSALEEIDLQKHLAVKRVADSLDGPSFLTFGDITKDGVVGPSVIRTMGDALGKAARINAISRLLELGILRTQYLRITPEILKQMKDQPPENMMRYKITPFGDAVYEEIANRLGILKEERLPTMVEKYIDDKKGQE